LSDTYVHGRPLVTHVECLERSVRHRSGRDARHGSTADADASQPCADTRLAVARMQQRCTSSRRPGTRSPKDGGSGTVTASGDALVARVCRSTECHRSPRGAQKLVMGGAAMACDERPAAQTGSRVFKYAHSMGHVPSASNCWGQATGLLEMPPSVATHALSGGPGLRCGAGSAAVPCTSSLMCKSTLPDVSKR
jgi:hypothetical protein